MKCEHCFKETPKEEAEVICYGDWDDVVCKSCYIKWSVLYITQSIETTGKFEGEI